MALQHLQYIKGTRSFLPGPAARICPCPASWDGIFSVSFHLGQISFKVFNTGVIVPLIFVYPACALSCTLYLWATYGEKKVVY